MELNYFTTQPFISALKTFFSALKVPVNYFADEPAKAADILGELFKENNPAHQLIDEVYVLGMIDDAAFEGNKSPEVTSIKSDYDGILIFGVELKKRNNGLLPTRGQLAEISRAFNREFHFTPVVVIFKYDGLIAFANTERIQYKQGWREGEKVGKVSILRDVNIKNPHRGHHEILKGLEIPTSGKNAVDSFSTLYKYWQEVFSVSILNKKFYKELQNWYFWAIKEVTFPNTPNRFDFENDEKFDDAVKEHKGKNVIRLLTRILFIWFIKEKGLIPEQLFDEKAIADKLIKDFTPQKPQGIFATGKQNSPYYRAILQNLFFATLNQEMGKRAFRGEGQHQNVTNLMRYKSYFKNPDYFVKLMEEVVPFMNGGLFECLDKPHASIRGKQGGDIIIYNDGFSDRIDNLLVVPDYLFFDVEEEVDLSDDFGSKVYKNSKIRGLLEILQSYKFTITENTPIEEDVALDPELLGKVFENLLASYNPETKTTARKQTGSFYTPREIVNYMVDESLIAYLKNNLKDDYVSEELLDQDLHQLLSYDNLNPYHEKPEIKKQLIKALDQCTILDPACGSGAFPMGILQKMVHVLHKVDPKNIEWEQRQIDRVNNAIESLEEIDDVRFREQGIKDMRAQIKDIEDSFENNELDYGRKLYLIENCIYGVDIQSIATQISKLRFFISLIVDQKIDKTKGNFGIRPLPNLETKFVAANTLIGIEKPKAQLNLFENKEIKKLEAELKKVRHKLFSSKSPATKRKLREDDKEIRNQIADLLVIDGWENKTARQLASWDPYDQNESSSFFDPEWMFDIKEGFDIVIGNPPYVFTRDVDFGIDFKAYVEKEYFSKIIRGKKSKAIQSGKINLFAVFAMKGLLLSKKGGCLTLIIPNNILRTTTYDIIRKYFLEQSHINQIVDLGSGVFENVTASTVIFNVLNNISTNNTSIITDIQNIETREFTINIIDQKQFFGNVSYSFNIYLEDKSIQISDAIKSNHIKLGDMCVDIIEGIVAHKHLIEPIMAKGYVELLEGKDIKCFFIDSPKNYLLWDKSQIHRSRPDYVWDSAYKIVIQRISGGKRPLVSAVDRNCYKTFASVNNLLLKEKYFNQYYFISAIINSYVVNWYYANNFSNNSNLTVNISKTYLDELPVVPFNLTVQLISLFLSFSNYKSDIYNGLLVVLNAAIFELYFPNHMKDREINVLKFIEIDIEKVLNGRDFEKLNDNDKVHVIELLHQIWTHPDNEVRKRMEMFKEESPDILKPILES